MLHQRIICNGSKQPLHKTTLHEKTHQTSLWNVPKQPLHKATLHSEHTKLLRFSFAFVEQCAHLLYFGTNSGMWTPTFVSLSQFPTVDLPEGLFLLRAFPFPGAYPVFFLDE